ncbi:MAG: bifunctional diaminohydroxyphosphoribosylaminopyrimidine deaminase/5-amino-6-(5-phosphoribosylamino)uracil reductase RibD [Kiritimatiellae bacterium]|nr:bifunctional diaminohydroxyphosphoribosylaminopyrimidine deaminase/5-amino-6-(5-phosphoribosylamino)uracil reductase RibD [Kiritimatiellia bacterium]
MTQGSAQDSTWMTRALLNARKAEGLTRPNPPVGAVLVKRGKWIADGVHRGAGQAHAEVNAIARVDDPKFLQDSTLYVTLEPCSTKGQTGACTHAIIDAGVRRVVYSVRDPNPAHTGRARRILKRAGIDVTEHVMHEEGQQLITPFAHWMQHRRPYVRLKVAATLDGRLADRNHRSQWISSPASRGVVQNMRKSADAVMIGVGTAIADDPSLLYRRAPRQNRFRVIVDTHARLRLTSQVLNDAFASRTIVATTKLADPKRLRAIRAKGATVWILPLHQNRVSLRQLMRRLGREGILSLLCEGGGGIAHGLMQCDLVDELHTFLAPKCLGGEGLAMFAGQGWTLGKAPALTFSDVRRIGPDILVVATRQGA